MAIERTLVLIKPDAVRRGLVGEVLARFERKGLGLVSMDLRMMDGALADRHYADHVEKPWYPPLREFMTSGPLVAAILEGDEAITVVRTLVGATDGRAAAAGPLAARRSAVHPTRPGRRCLISVSPAASTSRHGRIGFRWSTPDITGRGNFQRLARSRLPAPC